MRAWKRKDCLKNRNKQRKSIFPVTQSKERLRDKKGGSEHWPDSRRKNGGGGGNYSNDSIKSMAFFTSSYPMGVLGWPREMENISRGPTFGDFVTIRTEASMQDVTVARQQSTRVQTPPSFKCNVLRESLSVDSQNIPSATLKSWDLGHAPLAPAGYAWFNSWRQMEYIGCKCTQAVQYFIPGKMRTHGKHSRATTTNKTSRLGHFPPAIVRQLALPARCSMYMSFLYIYIYWQPKPRVFLQFFFTDYIR